jgi:hypothetical protein
MVKHRPWKFYYCDFVAGSRRHFTYIGAANRIEAMDIVFDLYGYFTDIHITLLGLWLLKNKGGKS